MMNLLTSLKSLVSADTVHWQNWQLPPSKQEHVLSSNYENSAMQKNSLDEVAITSPHLFQKSTETMCGLGTSTVHE